MILKSIEPVSCAKISGLLYAVLGLIVAFFFAMFAGCGAMLGGLSELDEFSFLGGVLGIGSFVFFPILYGILGFIGGLLMALIYNWLAGLFGGIEIQIETSPSEENF
ncbi:MAG: hypothetical protein ACE5G1_16415 [bacterium]